VSSDLLGDSWAVGMPWLGRRAPKAQGDETHRCSWCSWSRALILLGKATTAWAEGTGEAPDSLAPTPPVPVPLQLRHRTEHPAGRRGTASLSLAAMAQF